MTRPSTLLLALLLAATPLASDTITTIAGTGDPAFSGDGASAGEATLNRPTGIWFASDSSIYVSDTDNFRIRRISADGTITTVVGNGTEGFSGDGGPATDASINKAHGVAVSTDGEIILCDTRNHRIRKVAADGTISTIAGTGTAAFGGDEGPASEASLNRPHGLFLDDAGNIFFTDTNNNRVRRIDPMGRISTVAGNGVDESSGDGGFATEAGLRGPVGIVGDTIGTIYISERSGDLIRRIDAAGTIATVAGTGGRGFAGDAGPALSAELDGPRGLALDSIGNLYMADRVNQRIRKVDMAGTIATVAGSGERGSGGDEGDPLDAMLNLPWGIAVDQKGNVLITDRENHRVRKVDFLATPQSDSQPEQPTAPTPDFDGDGAVAFTDFLLFAGNFGTRIGDVGFDPAFDLDVDGEVGFSDFLAFATAFGKPA